MAAVKEAERAPVEGQEQSPDLQFVEANLELLLPLLTERVDLTSLFTQETTRYKVRDVKGKDRSFDIPNDLPFPVAIAFVKAHIAFRELEIRLAQAKPSQESEAEERWRAAWGRLADSFARVVAIRHPEILPIPDENTLLAGRIAGTIAATDEELDPRPGDRLQAEFGQVVLEHWMASLLLKLEVGRFALGYNAFEPAPKAASPKGRRKGKRSRSSR